MKKAGLKIREDVMGNVFGRWEGSKHGAGDHALLSGSQAATRRHAQATTAIPSLHQAGDFARTVV